MTRVLFHCATQPAAVYLVLSDSLGEDTCSAQRLNTGDKRVEWLRIKGDGSINTADIFATLVLSDRLTVKTASAQ